jgi:hypothetical protein
VRIAISCLRNASGLCKFRLRGQTLELPIIQYRKVIGVPDEPLPNPRLIWRALPLTAAQYRIPKI